MRIKFFVAVLMMLTFQTFAQSKMGPEAVEMFHVLRHTQVKECLDIADVDMVNVSIEKSVARCIGCNTYKITGNRKNIDTPNPEKTVITIKGKAVPSPLTGLTQTYNCDVKN